MSAQPAAPRVRVVSSQGTLQLLTALSVLACRAAEGEPPTRDYLAIYDVAPDFAASIERLARALHSWAGVTYIPPRRMAELGAQVGPAEGAELADLSRRPAIAALRELLGVPAADELLLVRNWQTSNQLLLAAYPNAERIAYGDGIGYYFGPSVFLPARPRKTPVRDLLQRLRGHGPPPAPPRLPTPPFSRAYLLLPEIFGERPPMPVTVPDRRYIEATIARAAAALGPEQQLALADDTPVTLFLPGNYAQAGWTSRDEEVAAYVESLRAHTAAGSLVLVKPHPRSTARDLAALQAALGRSFANVRLLEAPQSHLPVEVLIYAAAQRQAQLRAVGFTTAVIPLVYLFGIPSVAGFGDELLGRYFALNRDQMGVNERRLAAIIARLDPTPTPV